MYQLGGICKLVDLLRSPNQNVQQAAAGALRNLVFRSVTNKLETRRQSGIREAVSLLRRTGSTEIQKQLTGRGPEAWRAGGVPGPLAAAPRWGVGQPLRAGLQIWPQTNTSGAPRTGLGQNSGVHMVRTREGPRSF